MTLLECTCYGAIIGAAVAAYVCLFALIYGESRARSIRRGRGK